jgi:hypothetical protein
LEEQRLCHDDRPGCPAERPAQLARGGARVDGAGYLSRVFHITLPAIRPVSYFLLAPLSIECFKTFEQCGS